LRAADTGFVLDPGRSILSDIFGARAELASCVMLDD
jgi:hypothetical protein